MKLSTKLSSLTKAVLVPTSVLLLFSLRQADKGRPSQSPTPSRNESDLQLTVWPHEPSSIFTRVGLQCFMIRVESALLLLHLRFPQRMNPWLQDFCINHPQEAVECDPPEVGPHCLVPVLFLIGSIWISSLDCTVPPPPSSVWWMRSWVFTRHVVVHSEGWMKHLKRLQSVLDELA